MHALRLTPSHTATAGTSVPAFFWPKAPKSNRSPAGVLSFGWGIRRDRISTDEDCPSPQVRVPITRRVHKLMITHDIDEALFLADRLVMMTNGPAATIGEVTDIPFERPRDRDQIMEDPQYYQLRNHALDFLYNWFAHDEEI